MTMLDIFKTRWAFNGDYARKLAGNLSDEEIIRQPVPNVVMNHAAWVLSHLSVYGDAMEALLLDKPVPDPIDHPFGNKSTPLNDITAYGGAQQVLAAYDLHHAKVTAALEAASVDVLSQLTSLPRWRERHALTGDMLGHLIVSHEAVHLGQLSAWRRACGLPAV